MASTRLGDCDGPAILSYGFRPFFLFGALYAGLSMILWLPQFDGELELATLFAPVDWHIHELLFGYLGAVVTGFLFTAVPNWTGRMPIRGTPLLILFVLWAAGRLAVTFSAHIGWAIAMAIDVAFLGAVAVIVAREIFAGSNWRNLKVLAPLVLLLVANIGFHIEAHHTGVSDFSRRLALAVPVMLIMLIGGRIVPSFTRNWLVRENPGRLPAPFDRFDLAVMAATVAALGVWVAVPFGAFTGVALALSGVLQTMRLSRWAADRAWREPLIFMLHIGYAFIPLGLALLAVSQFLPGIPPLAGVHALGAGAIGTMTLTVMVRATLGHTGREMRASVVLKLLFACVLISPAARIAEALGIGASSTLLQVSAIAWFIAFTGFGVVFAPAVFRHRANAAAPST
ncbi:MAG: NnrS family protein [Rhizobiales bacterium]|nr:NnrS family protein [Hyphomicrobiales bacterium]